MMRMTTSPVSKHNNYQHLEDPDYNRTHVYRFEGLAPDPNGVMMMCNVKDIDPDSSNIPE